MRDWTKADRVKYKQDFPDTGDMNFVTIKIQNQTGNHENWNGVKRIGLLLHDGSWTMEGMYLESNEFEIIDNDPNGVKALREAELQEKTNDRR